MNESYDTTRDVTYHDDVPLRDFFERPVVIGQYTWGTADASPFYQAINPWTLYMTNKRVANRLTNYRNFSATLHVKAIVNGNSFMYGRIMVDYFPLKDYDTNSVVTVPLNNAIQASQRLHFYIDPTESQGGELALPFLWFKDKVNLVDNEQANLGRLYFREMAPLKHANGAVVTTNITLYAWATDVKLSIPTIANISGLVPQAGTMDEYGTGPVSGVASAIASAAGKLSSVPMIGKYARATQMMSGAMSNVASLFGFSRPADIRDYTDMHPAPVSRLANFNAGDNVAKLSLDAKQELSIDPSIVGLGAGDEMSIESIVTKESYLTQFTWTVAAAANTALWSARVGPLGIVDAPIPTTYYFPALTYATMPFRYWRGSIVYRFQIIASGFHKGRLLLVWDPQAQTAAPETVVQYTKIVDLADERDFTFEVGWGATTTYLNTPSYANMQAFSTSVINTADTTGSWNGVLSVYVLNDLIVPNTTVNNDILVNVFVSGCEDYKVSVPTGEQIKDFVPITSLVAQSGTFEEVSTENKNAPRNEDPKETFSMCQPITSNVDHVYFGETIVSLRQLLRRYSMWTSQLTTASASRGVVKYRMPDFPAHRGYTAYGAQAVVGTTPPYLNPSFTTIMHWLAVAYLGYRGGVRHKFIMNALAAQANILCVTRDPEPNSYSPSYLTYPLAVVSSLYAYTVDRLNSVVSNGQQGAHITTTPQQNALEFELPMYTNYRFLSPRNLGFRAAYAADAYSHTVTMTTPGISTNPGFDVYLAGAEDTTFIGFQGAPPLQRYILV